MASVPVSTNGVRADYAIGSGDTGTFDTLGTMASLVRDATGDATVVQLARSLVTSFGSTPFVAASPAAQARKIRNWLLGAWRFVEDPTNRELLRTPDAMLADYNASGYIMGDCDEAAILGAALGAAVGIPAKLNVLELDDGMGPGFSHVFASLLPSDGAEVTLDVTRPPPGSPMPRVLRWESVAI